MADADAVPASGPLVPAWTVPFSGNLGWDQLHTAIEESVHLKDDSFFESYIDLEI